MDKKKSWADYTQSGLKYFVISIMICCGIYFAYFVFAFNGRFSGMMPQRVYHLNEWTYMIGDGAPGPVTFPCELEVPKGVPVTYETRLPANIFDGDYLAISNSKRIRIMIDGVDRFDWNRKQAKIPGGPVKSFMLFVPLTSSDSGKIITVIKDDDLYNGGMQEIIIGDSLSVINELKRKSGMLQFVMAVFMFVLSFLLTICCVYVGKILNQKITLIYMCIGVMCLSGWLIFDSNVFQLVTDIRYIDGFLSYIMIFILVFPLLNYIDSLQEGRYRKVYANLGLIEVANFVICTILHITGVSSYYDSLVVSDLIIAWIILVTAGCIVMDVVTKKARSYIIVAVGLLIFLVLCIVEISLLNRSAFRVDGLFVILGSFVLFVLAMAQQIRDIATIQIERKNIVDAQKARTEFLTKMSHEIRTPINAILGMNEMILRETGKSAIREYAERIGHSGQVLMSLVNDILDYSAGEEEKQRIVLCDYDVYGMFNSITTVLRESATNKGIGVNVGISGDLPGLLRGDEAHIKRVIHNILSNAVKFTDKGNITFVVECETTEEGYTLIIYIKDTGKGISKEKLPHIFDAFSGNDTEHVKHNEGAGLGLNVTKKLVEEMDGTIEVESEEGVGTTFIVKIPQLKASVESFNSSTSQLYEHQNQDVDVNTNETLLQMSGGEVFHDEYSFTAPEANILAVDDNSANLVVVREFLKCIGAKLDEALSGEQAIEMCKSKKYDIIFMDHMMPDPDGVASMHIIKESLESMNRHTPIVVLTANVVCDCKERYLNEGFDDYLSKPVVHDALLDMVKKYVDPKLILVGNAYDVHKSDNLDVHGQPDKLNIEDDGAGIIDFGALYKRFENQEAVVNMVLSECVKEGGKKIVLLRELYDTQDIARYAVEAHGVKGVMASICAGHISERAKSHEFAAKENRVEFISEDLDGFLIEYKEVLDYVCEYLQKKGIIVEIPNISSDMDENSEEAYISKIEDALNGFDVEGALSYIEELEKIIGDDKKDILSRVRTYTDDFEYDRAIESLKELK